MSFIGSARYPETSWEVQPDTYPSPVPSQSDGYDTVYEDEVAGRELLIAAVYGAISGID